MSVDLHHVVAVLRLLSDTSHANGPLQLGESSGCDAVIEQVVVLVCVVGQPGNVVGLERRQAPVYA